MPPFQHRRATRKDALVELERLHAAILASRERRGATAGLSSSAEAPLTPEALATRELTRRLKADRREPRFGQVDARSSRRGWWLGIAAAVLVVGVWTAFTLGQRSEVVTEAATPAASIAAPSASAATGAAVASAPAPAKAVHLTLEATRAVWMRVMVDGRRAIEREVAAGEALAFEGETAVIVRVGDGGGVRASMNGADRGVLGRDGWPVTVPFSVGPIEAEAAISAPRTPRTPDAPVAPAPEPAPDPAPEAAPTSRPPG